jgi:CHAT domain-containing protein
MLAESMQYENYSLLASRSIENDTLNRGSVKYLPGTKKEAEMINTLLKENQITAKLYTSSKANEESFKSLSGKHNNIIHIGTHGFTWTDSIAKKQDYFTQRFELLSKERDHSTTIDPLTRCGLLFAGSNIALSGHSSELPDGVQDGILTAKEISLMDLRDANLVVLSACETAKGDITSEGVFGLQRAFKMAGVQTIIMSLWKVNDQATQLLMTEFYNNWISKNQSKREAFRNAQNIVRTQYEEPVYWAGFIMLD